MFWCVPTLNVVQIVIRVYASCTHGVPRLVRVIRKYRFHVWEQRQWKDELVKGKSKTRRFSPSKTVPRENRDEYVLCMVFRIYIFLFYMLFKHWTESVECGNFNPSTRGICLYWIQIWELLSPLPSSLFQVDLLQTCTKSVYLT